MRKSRTKSANKNTAKHHKVTTVTRNDSEKLKRLQHPARQKPTKHRSSSRADALQNNLVTQQARRLTWPGLARFCLHPVMLKPGFHCAPLLPPASRGHHRMGPGWSCSCTRCPAGCCQPNGFARLSPPPEGAGCLASRFMKG